MPQRPDTAGGVLVPNGGRWITAAELARQTRRDGEDTVSITLPGMLSFAEWRAWRRLRESQFFLVRNRGTNDVGERWHCGRCSTYHVENGIKVLDPIYHEFFTLCCAKQPFRGLDGALWAYASLTSNERLARHLAGWNPELGRIHPRTFGGLVPPREEADIIGIAIGTLEDITPEQAREYARQINQRRPPQPFVL
jgi:hypothetical protein